MSWVVDYAHDHYSLCPVNSSIPITANGIIPIGEPDVASIPSVAYKIPDFEGQAILRIFSNTTQQEIGCYSAVVTNGYSFGQPKSVGAILGILTFVSLVASFATATYGERVPTMRLHYAHSLSVGVVFAVFQHIFFTGALSMNWPSVLVAWWSNFAWAGGMIYSGSMQSSINRFIGNDIGSTAQVGAAAAGSSQENVGGGFDISQIYKRAFNPGFEKAMNHPLMRDLASHIYERTDVTVLKRDTERLLHARDVLVDRTDGYRWYGHPVGPGLPLPGNYSGFAGTLAQEGISISNAFMTGFLWLLILLVILTAAVIGFKWILEGLARFKRIKPDRLKFFRDHWIRYTAAIALRICYVAFFLMMFLTIFQFTIASPAGAKAVAAIVFIIFIVGVPGTAAYAYYYKKHFAGNDAISRRNQVEHKKLLGVIPWAYTKKNGEGAGDNETQGQATESKEKTKPFWKRSSTINIQNPDEVDNIHDNDDYTMKFGWLTSRFRRTRWWFFTVWLLYEFVRAVFYAGASGYALAQVFGLLIIESIAFAFIIWARPFESTRLNVIVVYCLGCSKITSIGLSAAFDVKFNLPRITTTVIGVVIIVIQGILTIITMVAIVIGAISSYMSVSRNHEEIKPKSWHGYREKYFDHLDRVANDLPREPKPPKPAKKKQPEEPVEVEPGFEVRSMKRLAKIEDEDEEFASEMRSQNPDASYLSLNNGVRTPVNASETALAGQRSGTASPTRRSRAGSVQSMSQANLPFGARPHRPSWTTRDFSPVGGDNPERTFTPIDMSHSVPDDEPVIVPTSTKGGRSRTSSMRSATNPMVPPQASTDSLRLGGDVSTRDTIGNVPAPTARPRTGTHGSLRGSRSATPSFGPGEMGETIESPPGSRPMTRYPLTPAQEMEEFVPKQAREQ